MTVTAGGWWLPGSRRSRRRVARTAVLSPPTVAAISTTPPLTSVRITTDQAIAIEQRDLRPQRDEPPAGDVVVERRIRFEVPWLISACAARPARA